MTNAEIDRAVAEARLWTGPFGDGATRAPEQWYWVTDGSIYPHTNSKKAFNYSPTTNPRQWVELMEEMKGMVYWSKEFETWIAGDADQPWDDRAGGSTPGRAMCKAYLEWRRKVM